LLFPIAIIKNKSQKAGHDFPRQVKWEKGDTSAFDREKQKVFHLPIVITDSGIPVMSSTNTLTITVGDENDNCHEFGHKDIYVYSNKGKYYLE